MCKVCGPIVGTSNSKDRFDRWIRLRIASSSSQLRTEKIVILSFRIGVEIQNIQERSQWRFTQPLLILLQTDLQCCLDFEHIVNLIVMRVFYLFICFCCLFLTTSLIICHANLSVRSRMTTYHTHAFDHLQRFSIKSQNHICTQRLTYQNEASYDDPFMNLDDIFLLQWYCCLRKGWWFCLFYKEPCAAIAVHRRIYNCCGGSWPKYKTSQEQVSLSHAIYKNT